MTQLLATLDSYAPGRPLRWRALLVPLLALAIAGGGVALAVGATRPEPREVTLVARGMAFYLPDDPTPNPRLVVASGEPLRLLLRNDDRGMPHDLAVPDDDGDWIRTREVRGAGETAALTFEAPDTPGTYEYVCLLHSRMMRGILLVQ
jgi:Cupredoxin-like domain